MRKIIFILYFIVVTLFGSKPALADTQYLTLPDPPESYAWQTWIDEIIVYPFMRWTDSNYDMWNISTNLDAQVGMVKLFTLKSFPSVNITHTTKLFSKDEGVAYVKIDDVLHFIFHVHIIEDYYAAPLSEERPRTIITAAYKLVPKD